MSEQDATTTFLVCFSGRENDQGTRTEIQVCLGFHPAVGKSPGGHFIRVNLQNVRVVVPNPLPASQPITATVGVQEVLPLSAQDIKSLEQWLHTYASGDRSS
jgi:hypothetical protein